MASTIRAGVALLGLLALPSAQALTFCVNDVVTFKAAMNLGQFGTDTPLQVKMVQGTYPLDSDAIYFLAAPSSIEGGYTAGCASRVINPNNTSIDIGLGHQLSWIQNLASPEARLSVSGLTFRNSNAPIQLVAGRHDLFSDDEEGSLHLSNVRFTQLASLSLRLGIRSSTF
jgi:hypothetical protein